MILQVLSFKLSIVYSCTTARLSHRVGAWQDMLEQERTRY
jgi:hypothetical protein